MLVAGAEAAARPGRVRFEVDRVVVDAARQGVRFVRTSKTRAAQRLGRGADVELDRPGTFQSKVGAHIARTIGPGTAAHSILVIAYYVLKRN